MSIVLSARTNANCHTSGKFLNDEKSSFKAGSKYLNAVLISFRYSFGGALIAINVYLISKTYLLRLII